MHNGNEHNLPARRAIGYSYQYQYCRLRVIDERWAALLLNNTTAKHAFEMCSSSAMAGRVVTKTHEYSIFRFQN